MTAPPARPRHCWLLASSRPATATPENSVSSPSGLPLPRWPAFQPGIPSCGGGVQLEECASAATAARARRRRRRRKSSAVNAAVNTNRASGGRQECGRPLLLPRPISRARLRAPRFHRAATSIFSCGSPATTPSQWRTRRRRRAGAAASRGRPRFSARGSTASAAATARAGGRPLEPAAWLLAFAARQRRASRAARGGASCGWCARSSTPTTTTSRSSRRRRCWMTGGTTRSSARRTSPGRARHAARPAGYPEERPSSSRRASRSTRPPPSASTSSGGSPSARDCRWTSSSSFAAGTTRRAARSCRSATSRGTSPTRRATSASWRARPELVPPRPQLAGRPARRRHRAQLHLLRADEHRRAGPVLSRTLRAINVGMTRAYCDHVIKLSDTLQPLPRAVVQRSRRPRRLPPRGPRGSAAVPSVEWRRVLSRQGAVGKGPIAPRLSHAAASAGRRPHDVYGAARTSRTSRMRQWTRRST